VGCLPSGALVDALLHRIRHPWPVISDSVPLQHWRIPRRRVAVAVVTVVAALVFAGLAAAFASPLINGVTHLAHGLPTYVGEAAKLVGHEAPPCGPKGRAPHPGRFCSPQRPKPSDRRHKPAASLRISGRRQAADQHERARGVRRQCGFRPPMFVEQLTARTTTRRLQVHSHTAACCWTVLSDHAGQGAQDAGTGGKCKRIRTWPMRNG